MTAEEQKLFGIDKLNVPRSDDPCRHARRLFGAHPDRSSRRPIRASTRSSRHSRTRTGCPVLVNTSFNVRGEPIVCTPEDAFRCFMGTDIEMLVCGSFVLRKADQPQGLRKDYSAEFELD